MRSVLLPVVKRATPYGVGAGVGFGIKYIFEQEESFGELAPYLYIRAYDSIVPVFSSDRESILKHYAEVAEKANTDGTLSNKVQKFRLSKEGEAFCRELESTATDSATRTDDSSTAASSSSSTSTTNTSDENILESKAERMRELVHNFKGDFDQEDVLNYSRAVGSLEFSENNSATTTSASDLLVDCTVQTAKLIKNAKKFDPFSAETVSNVRFENKTEVEENLKFAWKKAEKNLTSKNSSVSSKPPTISPSDLLLVKEHLSPDTVNKLIACCKTRGGVFGKAQEFILNLVPSLPAKNGDLSAFSLPFYIAISGCGLAAAAVLLSSDGLGVFAFKILPPAAAVQMEVFKAVVRKSAGEVQLALAPTIEKIRLRAPFELKKHFKIVAERLVLLQTALVESCKVGGEKLAKNFNGIKIKEITDSLNKAILKFGSDLKNTKILGNLKTQLNVIETKLISLKAAAFSPETKAKFQEIALNLNKSVHEAMRNLAQLIRRLVMLAQASFPGRKFGNAGGDGDGVNGSSSSLPTIQSEEIEFVNEADANTP